MNEAGWTSNSKGVHWPSTRRRPQLVNCLVFWFLLETLPYLRALYLARAHIERNTGGSALAARPVMFELQLEMSDPLARRYQWFWLILLLTLPLWASMFLLNEVFELLMFQRKHGSGIPQPSAWGAITWCVAKSADEFLWCSGRGARP